MTQMIIISLLNNPILIVSNAHNRTRETESIYSRRIGRLGSSENQTVWFPLRDFRESLRDFDFQEETVIRSLRRCAKSWA